MYTLYGAPGSASTAAHLALEEASAAYEFKHVDLEKREHETPEYLKLNPNGKVPTLIIDGRFAIYESAAILAFIADRHPEAGLAPATTDLARGLYYQWIMHMTNTLQPAIMRYYRPERHSTDAAAASGIKEKARLEIAALWEQIDRHLGAQGPYFLGARFSAADLFGFMLSTWQGCCPDIYQRFANVKRLADLVAARPAVARVMARS